MPQALRARPTVGLGPALDLHAAFTYTNARVDGGSLRRSLGWPAPRRDPGADHHGRRRPGATWTARTLTAEVRYESDRFDDDQNTRLIKAGTGVDARAEWRITPAVGAYIAADNLFNANIETGRSAANVVTYDAPRIVRVGLTLRR